MFIKKDIANITRTLKKIAEGDTNMRVTTETFDKNVSELCNAINAVLEAENRARRSGERASLELQQAITNISHDLRTPLSSATGYAQMLRTGNVSAEKSEEYLGIIETRLQALSRLMDELFEYTKVLEGRSEPLLERVNVSNLLRDIITSYYAEFTKKDFKVEVNIPDEPVYVTCDLTALNRLAQNLIQNALTHGTEHFTLTVDSEAKQIIFENKVIEMPDVERLFDRFYTSDVSRTGKTTGLGLAIARELVKGMGGEISARADGDVLSIEIKL